MLPAAAAGKAADVVLSVQPELGLSCEPGLGQQSLGRVFRGKLGLFPSLSCKASCT